MYRPHSSIDNFVNHQRALIAHARGGFAVQGGVPATSEPFQPTSTYLTLRDLQTLYTTGNGRGQGVENNWAYQGGRWGDVQAGQAGGPFPVNRTITRVGPPVNTRRAPNRASIESIPSKGPNGPLAVDANEINGAAGFPYPTPFPSGPYLRGQFYSQGQSEFQINPVHSPPTLDASGPPYAPLGFQSGRGYVQPQRGAFTAPRVRGRGNNHASRGSGIGTSASPSKDFNPEELALRNLTISAQGTNPLLRPVVFVKGRTTLFQEYEEILKSEVAATDMLDLSCPPPSADQVEALFHRRQTPPPAALSNNNLNEDCGPARLSALLDDEVPQTDSIALPLFDSGAEDSDSADEDDEDDDEDGVDDVEDTSDEGDDPCELTPTTFTIPNAVDVGAAKASVDLNFSLRPDLLSPKPKSAVFLQSRAMPTTTPHSWAPLLASSLTVPLQSNSSPATKGKQKQPLPVLSKKQLKKQKKAEKERRRAEARRKAAENLEYQIRSFVQNNNKNSITLSHVQKKMHKVARRLAVSFKLNINITGKRKRVTMTITKTAFTKVGTGGNFGFQPRQREIAKDGDTKGNISKPIRREGEEIGKHAAKIDNSNIGYQLLQTMGWTEGDRIGVAGGLEAPLEAVFKISKRGLGAQP